MTEPHLPVLLAEVLAGLAPALRPGAVVFDGTIGAGGHAREILPRLLPGGRYVGADRDQAALALAEARVREGGEEHAGALCLLHRRFGDLAEIAREQAPDGFSAILLDVGVSSMQIDEGARGFSFRDDAGRAPLDMRMDPSAGPTAADFLHDLTEEELANLIYRYGEERLSRRIAKAICRARKAGGLTTTGALADTISSAVGRGYERGRIHPATRTFQALRIAVNDELGELERALAAIPDALRPGGRAAVVSFHSLEDRLVKHAFRDAKKAGRLQVLTKKPIVAGPDEVRSNRRARSAKLRIAERPA